ncbi:MAG: glycosyl hydrolase family 8 [Ruminococcus flavefaciens]|nr:glycosyl hydrolase family 8 [Ruminococcus flavefaciens]MCM1362164.1 glycosyl hydrolase family 8 [Clostridiales bacterium]MCM1435438.1 glycosyl hydrolase family 8 [Ruminococcus flavefaciens]
MKIIKRITTSIVSVSFAASLAVSAPLFVNAYEPSALSEDTLSFYEQWKEKYLTHDKYVMDETQYYIYYSEEHYDGGNASVPVTVSEAHGYGMLIFASMTDYDAQAKEYFDGMYRYFKAHPSDIGPNLMSWQQCDNGTALIDGANDGAMTGGFCDSATDGDMDIAYALLMADSVWGSSGDIDYLSEAKAVIDDIMKYDINHEFWTITLGDWVSECDSREIYYHATRPSDFIVQYFPVFAEVSGDSNWMKVYDTTYKIIEDITSENGKGLLPDFVIRDSSGKFTAAQPNFLESEYDGCYSYNSCRTPWRISMDYIINGNETAKKFAENITSFASEKSGNDPWELMAGYDLNGNAIEDYNDLCFTAPFLIAAACTDNNSWHSSVRDVILDYGEDVYYGDTIKMLCLIVDDGGWIVPAEKSVSVRGDVNDDGVFSIADLVMAQRYILGNGDLTNWKNGDLCEDNVFDSFDLVIMRQMISDLL